MKEMKRILSIFLCLIMLVGIVPVTALAEEAADDQQSVVTPTEETDTDAAQTETEPTSAGEDETTAPEDETSAPEDETTAPEEEQIAALAETDTIYILAGGDFQEAGDHSNSATNVANILSQIYGAGYTTMNGFLFIGDYDCETHDSASETANGIAALMDTVDDTYTNLNHSNSILVQGNHDYRDSNIDSTGGHDFDGYSVYVLNEDDYPNGGGSQAGIQTLANNLKTWLNNKLGEGYDAPIFITSHLPLAFTPRTVTQGDAKYAKYIFDVLNDAGNNGLNIIFLHGHDHAYGPDNYMGGEAIYLPVGDKICIAEAGSTSQWTEETLNFTYMNAGYTGYYSDPYTYVTTAGTDKLTMTVFAITGSQVKVERYSANGLYNLKSAGYDGSYSNTSVTNVSLGLPKYSTVYASPQTIALTATEDYGNIGGYVEVATQTNDDVTTSGNEWTTITAPVSGTTTYTYTQATSITKGGKYVIVGNSDNVALMDNSGSMGGQDVAISGSTMTSNTALTEWTFSDASSGTVYNGTRYLRYNDSSFSLSQSSTTFTFTENNGSFRIQSGNASFYYNGYSWTRSRYIAQYVRLYQLTDTTTVGGTNGLYGRLEGGLTYNVEIGTSAEAALAAVKAGIAIKYATASDYSDEQTFADDGEGMTWTLDPAYDPNTPGDYAVTIAYNGVTLGVAEVVIPTTTAYYIAEGNGLYIVDMNTTEANALAAVKAGITVSSATDAHGSNKTAISDDAVTWKWVDTYSGADAGPYTVEILKDGISLGTVEVKVNVRYDTGINSDWTYIGESEATGGSHIYVLDTNGIDYGSNNKYLIVGYLSSNTDGSYDYALTANGSNTGVVPVKISGNTATVDSRAYEWYFATGLTNTGSNTYNTFITQNGTTWLYHTNSSMYVGNGTDAHRGYWSATHRGNGVYRFGDQDGSTWYLRYSDSGRKFTVKNSTSSNDVDVRLYKYDRSTGGTPGGPIYALIEGPTVYTVTQGTSAAAALAKVKAGITAYTATDANGTNKTDLADSSLTWKWKNTFNGNTIGSYWVEISYEGKVLGTVEVRVEPRVVNNYPDYPDEGAVKVNKTATGVDFQSSGVAIVELSASGVPIKKGADVIIMLDTSSSMTSHTVTGSSKTRAAVLEESLKNMIAQFKTPGADGELLDIRVAIADFNGFYGENHNSRGTPYDRDAADMMSDGIYYNANSEAQVYTGDHTLGAGAFIPVEDLAASYTLNYTSGTNYDYAFDAIYQLGTAIKESNGSEERDLFVIFMSDGAAMQWNYYHSQGASKLWNSWITGAWTANQLSLNCNTHAYYYDEVDHNGDGMRNEHRMANAIKGDPNALFEVIRKTNTLGTPTDEANMYMVPGLGAKLFSISFDAKADTNVTEESMDKSIASLATPQTGTTQYYYKVTTANELSSAFTAIGSEIAYAAYNARFVDNMGADFDLQMANREYLVEGSTTETATIEPVIEVLTYDIYTRADYEANNITEDQIGNRKGTYTLNEVVKFSEDGTKAYSNLIDVDGDGKYGVTVNTDGTYTINDTDDNIFRSDGVIQAVSFLYNTSDVPVTITTATKSVTVEPEQFYWNMETITTTELALRYYVYLTGSMDGKEAGSYPTNESAILYYDNYLGNPCYKETVSPVLAWKAANVSFAFYLVNSDGQPVNMNGEVVPFANRVTIVDPTLYKEVLLNTDDTVVSLDVISTGVLPDGYALYDEAARYTVSVKSNSTGNWQIVKGDGLVASTYITNFSKTEQYSNELTTNHSDHDYSHTIVWFALKWEPQPLPDTVVIDFALPVEIHILTNDMFGSYGKMIGIEAGNPHSLNKETTFKRVDTPATGVEAAGDFGTAKVTTHMSENGETHTLVRYELKDSSLLQMTDADVFTYYVQYANSNYAQNNGYYCSTVTVIPATTIYYEDEFVDLGTYTWDDNSGWVETDGSRWQAVQDDTYVEGADIIQDEDRPGNVKFAFDTVIDANNVYGYDSAYAACSKYSLGSAAMAHVDYDTSAAAKFSFYGTGFDVISMTSNLTGAITVRVTDDAGTVYRNIAVDTYYGYAQDANGNWVVSKNDPDALYQVPVIKVEGLTYGKYNVTVRATYDPIFDHGQYTDKTYDFYLDAIRIYDPANDGEGNTQIGDAYEDDKERWPVYQEVRNNVIEAAELAGESEISGIVFIDSKDKTALVADYSGVGPNNELYLASNQAIAFKLNLPANVASVHIGIKSATGSTVSYKIFDGNTVTDKATLEALTAKTISTATDMYYDITSLKDKTIVIYNSGESGIISLTDIKVTFTQKPDVIENFFQASKETIDKLVANMNTTIDQTPAKFEIAVTPTTAIVGGKVIVKVTTGSDVSAVRIDGMMITGYSVSGENRIWTAKVAVPEVTNSVVVETYNNEGYFTASKTVTVTAVNVEDAAENILKTVATKLKTLLGW